MIGIEEKELVVTTWRRVTETVSDPGVVFYNQLFTAAPELRPMFKGDLNDQARKLIHMISVAVRQLDDLDALLPALHAMGRRHVAYGVRPEHYAVVRTALLATLALALQEAFTKEASAAWSKTYDALSATMIAADAGVE